MLGEGEQAGVGLGVDAAGDEAFEFGGTWKTGPMGDLSGSQEATHDWAAAVDCDHLARVRRDLATFTQGGVSHLVLEVIAYAAEEAERHNGGLCVVTLHRDGSVSVGDNGRGTATRFEENGQPVKKPVMSSKDLRFFDSIDPPLLPDGHPRRGISVVAALSKWLVHTNRRRTEPGRNVMSTAFQ